MSTASNSQKPTPEKAPVAKPPEELDAVLTIRELMAQNRELMARLAVVEQHKSAMEKVIRAPQAVHIGPREPVTYKTSKGNMRTDR